MSGASPSKEFLVIGLGRFGSSLAEKLDQIGCDVLATDSDPKVTQQMSSVLRQVVTADATSTESLNAIGAQAFHTAIVCIGQDFESSILITNLLKHDFGIKKVIAKALTFRQRQVLLLVGADQVVLPEHESGVRLATELGETPG